MTQHSVTVRCPTPSSFAVDQVRGMFDLARTKEASETFTVEVPERGELIDDKIWQIGVIVGPSGSGKSTIARDLYGKQFVDQVKWDPTKAVIDQFGDADMKQVVGVLNAVGFSSPPSWIKPHQVLSGGERFRCDLARSLVGGAGLIAFDEFTSVVDRTVAKIGSAAVAKSIRKGRIQKQFVAVTCHYDVLDWLEPDWVLDMASCELTRGCLWRRPKIELQVAPVHRSAWNLFRRHHYLNHEIHKGAKCFAAFWPQPDGTCEPVAFSSWMHRMTRKRQSCDMREHRTVVLPDFQGVGIGNRLSEMCASLWLGLGGRAFSTTSHPAMIRYRNGSANWKTIRYGMVAASGRTGLLMRRAKKGQATDMERARLATAQGSGKRAIDSVGRVTGGFQYVGPAMNQDQAKAWLDKKPRVFMFSADESEVIDALKATGGTTAKGVARRTSLTNERAGQILSRLAAQGEIERFAIGNRSAYAVLDQ